MTNAEVIIFRYENLTIMDEFAVAVSIWYLVLELRSQKIACIKNYDFAFLMMHHFSNQKVAYFTLKYSRFDS